MITVTPINAFVDNYIWVISRQNSPYCVVVDPGEAAPVHRYLQANGLQLAAILLTHHHWDHTGGVKDLLAEFPVDVYGPANDNIEGLNHLLKDGDSIHLAELDLQLAILDIPGHTHGHIAYYGHNSLFCGDTLFAGGCGRIFEGTAEQMFQSLEKILALPDNTDIYCAHEYTLANLEFARLVEPDNAALQDRFTTVKNLRNQQLITLPSTLKEEKLTNPFLRSDKPAIIAAANNKTDDQHITAVDVFKTIRAWKDTI